MPPLKGIERGITGQLLCQLEELGHGDRITIVDASYSIPRGAERGEFHGDSSAKALRGILDLVPIDTVDDWDGMPNEDSDRRVLAMLNDQGKQPAAYARFKEARLGFPVPLVLIGATRKGQRDGSPYRHPDGAQYRGFYATMLDPHINTLFVRTRDRLASACASFMVGHSQE